MLMTWPSAYLLALPAAAPCSPLHAQQYTIAYTGGWLWTLFLIVPPSIAIDLAFPTVISGSDNV